MFFANIPVPTPLLAITGLFAIFFGGLGLLIMITARFEKRHIRSWIRMPPGAKPEPNAYYYLRNEQASAAGFTPCGPYEHAKGGMYKLNSLLWLSPDRTILAVVGWGTIANLPSDRTFLYSRFGKEKVLVTNDNYGERDMSGTTEYQTINKGQFSELLDRHLLRLSECAQELGRKPDAFTAEDPMNDYESILTARADRLEELSLAAYADPGRTIWHYTTRGALKFYFDSHMKQMKEAKQEAVAKRQSAAGMQGLPPELVRAGLGPASANASPTGRLSDEGLRKLDWLFIFMGAFGIYLYQKSPAANAAQSAFRLGLIAVGALGLLTTYAIRFSRRKK